MNPIRNFLREAVQKFATNMAETKSGLVVPRPYVAGQHFGGFDGYQPWIRDCVTAACTAARGVPPDELSEITALTLWTAEDAPPDVFVDKHGRVVRALDDYGARLVEENLADEGFRAKAAEQVRKADALRERGTLLVVAVRWENVEHDGRFTKDLALSVSAWNPASLEEARAVPKRKYQLST